MCLLLCRIQYPGFDERLVNNFLEKLRLDAWLKLYAATEPLDKINILNSVIFGQYGFKGNSGKYHSPDNSFLNKVMETRQGNPITLCCLYAIIAQKLGIPVFGVNLPQHFILAWCEEPGEAQVVPFAPQHRLKRSEYGKVLFYINPFSGGQLFPRKSIDEFLEKIAVSPREEFYEPCNNMEIFTRMLRNLQYSYGENSNHQKLGIIEKLMQLLPNP
jgi:regulator of sirC expression with transglutaminase-like and TPR domain